MIFVIFISVGLLINMLFGIFKCYFTDENSSVKSTISFINVEQIIQKNY